MMVSLELFSDTNILYVYLVYILYDAQLNNHRDPPHSYEMLHRVLLEILHSLLGRIRKCSGFDTFRIQMCIVYGKIRVFLFLCSNERNKSTATVNHGKFVRRCHSSDVRDS